jgi:hypothetical protein
MADCLQLVCDIYNERRRHSNLVLHIELYILVQKWLIKKTTQPVFYRSVYSIMNNCKDSRMNIGHCDNTKSCKMLMQQASFIRGFEEVRTQFLKKFQEP